MATFDVWRNALNAGLQAHKALNQAQRTRQLYTGNARSLLGGQKPLAKFAGTTRPKSWKGLRKQALRGTLAGQFMDDVDRYARGGATGSILGKVLGQLGPVGKAISFIFGRETDKSRDVNPASIKSAIDLLNSLGYNVAPPATGTGGTGKPPKAPGKAPTSPPQRTGTGGRSTSQPPPQAQPQGPQPPTGRFVSDQYIPMQLVAGSSNVYAIGYNPDTRTCRVQYLASAVFADAIKGRGHKGRKRARGTLGRTVSRKRSGPGPVYDYHNVPPGIFKRLQAASSKGKAIWDNLRIRGTVYGHQYDYTLAAASVVDVIQRAVGGGTSRKVASITYVPRRAVGPGKFVGRTMLQGVGRSARQYRSILPNQ
jgi:hypothetical protein